MMRFLPIIGLLIAGSANAQPPTQAALAGYDRLVFNDVGNIDLANTQQPGFSWYLANWFGAPPGDAVSVHVGPGVLTLGGSGTKATLQSAFASGAGYVGSVFGGGGYFEIDMAIGAPIGANTRYPAFFLDAIEAITNTDQWPGQAAGYVHFVEIDVMEFYRTDVSSNTTNYLAGLHDWSGGASTNGFPVSPLYNIQNSGNYFAIPSQPVNWQARHRYGMNWKLQLGNIPGSFSMYFDDVLMSTTYYLGPVSNPPLSGQDTGIFTPSTPAQATQTYAIADGHHYAMRIQTDQVWPIAVYGVKVWQH